MKNQNKGFIVPLLVAIIAVLIIGGGMYIYKNKKIETPITSTKTDTEYTPTQTQTVPPSLLDKNSKSYINTSKTFSIEYPAQFQVQHQAANEIHLTNSSDCLEKAKTQLPGEFSSGCLYASARSQNNKITVDGQGVVKQQMSIAGISGEKTVSDNEYFSVMGQVEKNGQWYIIIVNSNTIDKVAAINLFDQLVSDFRFTN